MAKRENQPLHFGHTRKSLWQTCRKLLVVAFFIFTISACVQPGTVKNQSLDSLKKTFALPAQVVNSDGNRVTLQVEKPLLYGEQPKLALQLAQGVIDNTYFLEGRETFIGDTPAKVLRFSGDRVLVQVPKEAPRLETGAKTEIYLSKKTIAIQDFEVIRGRDPTVAKYIQEDVTTALVNSDQFNVLERMKLQSILDELQLGQSGLVDPKQAKKVGNLIGADLILTGTLAATGKNWTGNLRLINTETGLIISAINRSGSMHELKGEAFRESGNISGDFDDKNADLSGWLVGERIRKTLGGGGYQTVRLDLTSGADGSPGSLAMDFKLGEKRLQRGEPIMAAMVNLMKRDLYSYEGIEFYIKSSEALTAIFLLTDKPDDQAQDERWFRPIVVSERWEKVRVDFNSLSLNKQRALQMKTNQELNLQAVETLSWMIVEKNNPLGTEGTLWIDQVKLY